MDKTIIIDGRQVTFRKTAGTMMRYKKQFGRELNTDLKKIYQIIPKLKEQLENDKEAAVDAFLSIETEWMYNILFTMAKQANPHLYDVVEWLDSFETFNVWAVFFELLPMLQAEQEVHPKNA